MSVNDLLDSDVLIPAMLVMFLVIMIFAIPVGLAMGKKANKEIYGDDEYGVIKEERNAKVLARRTAPHPMNQAVMINMVVFELANGSRVELAIKDAQQYGIMIEGDCGTLTYQGKKFVSFERGNGVET